MTSLPTSHLAVHRCDTDSSMHRARLAVCQLCTAVVFLWLLIPAHASAQGAFVTAELSGVTALTSPQRQEFGLGGTVALGLLFPVIPQLTAGLRARALMLTDGDVGAAQGRVNYGRGTLYLGELVLRLRPLVSDSGRANTGLFLEGAFGSGATGRLLRSTYSVGLGWAFSIGDIAIAPVARYLQVIQRSDALSDEDARLGLLGFELAFGDPKPPTPAAEAVVHAKVTSPVVPPLPPPEANVDEDGDGLVRDEDACPTEAEDIDGEDDRDGCPDLDADGDGVADAQDLCASEAEDIDGYEDIDGCPEEDPDGDRDGIADATDLCPEQAEVVNGNEDEDGCPDEGLIELKDHRIVLEGTVLFDMERVRIRSAAQPVLRAIVTLQSQHPEWQKIHVEGHADARGKESYNQRLSERRARKVRDALVQLGIPEPLIESHGYGSSRLRDRHNTEAAHRRNRRVEFVVLPTEIVVPAGDPAASAQDTVTAAELGPSAAWQGGRP